MCNTGISTARQKHESQGAPGLCSSPFGVQGSNGRDCFDFRNPPQELLKQWIGRFQCTIQVGHGVIHHVWWHGKGSIFVWWCSCATVSWVAGVATRNGSLLARRTCDVTRGSCRKKMVQTLLTHITSSLRKEGAGESEPLPCLGTTSAALLNFRKFHSVHQRTLRVRGTPKRSQVCTRHNLTAWYHNCDVSKLYICG